MNDPLLTGTVSFVNHEKNYVLIEYEEKGKKRSARGSTNDEQHEFRIGDTVSFKPVLKGEHVSAAGIRFLYNSALDVLINKARTQNNFIGYLKVADDKYFVKEIDSYLFFPVQVSPWQIMPTGAALNTAVTFSLENLDKKDKLTAKLYNSNYIPEFHSLVKANKTKTAIEAEVYKVSPHGIYLDLFGDKIRSKLPNPGDDTIKVGDKIKVMITHIGKDRVIVERVA
jgi:hypothetical protein